MSDRAFCASLLEVSNENSSYISCIFLLLSMKLLGGRNSLDFLGMACGDGSDFMASVILAEAIPALILESVELSIATGWSLDIWNRLLLNSRQEVSSKYIVVINLGRPFLVHSFASVSVAAAMLFGVYFGFVLADP